MSNLESIETLLEKAKSDELVNNWLGAAELYKKVADDSFIEGKITEAAEYYAKLGYAYSRAALASESSEQYYNRSRNAIETYKNAEKLFEQINNKAKRLECEASVYYITSISEKSLNMAKEAANKSFELYVQSSEQYSKKKDNESIARTLSQAAKVSVSLILYSNDQEEVLESVRKARDVSEKTRKISEEIGNVQYLAEALNTEVGIVCDMRTYNIEFQILSIMPKNLTKRFYLRYEKYLDYVENTIDNRVLATVHNVVGRYYLDYGIVFVEEEKEKQTYFDKAITKLESSVGYARKSEDKPLLISNLYDFFQAIAVSGKIDYLIRKREEYLPILVNLSSIFSGSFNYWSFFIHLALANYYSNTVMYSYGMMTVANKEPYAKRGIMYALKALELTNFVPYRIHLFAILTNFYSFLALSTSSKNQQEDYADKMRSFARKAKASGKDYDEGNPQPTQPQFTYHSALSVAYKTLADISEDKDKKAQNLLKAANALEKSNVGQIHLRLLIESKLTLGALYEELGILTLDVNQLLKAKEALKEAIEISLRTGYTSARIIAFDSIARIDDRLGDYTSAAKYFEKVKNALTELLKVTENEDSKAKIKEQIEYKNIWSMIESARAYHKIEDHLKAKDSYVKASEILQNLPTFIHEASYYGGWALLEEAEYLSEEERPGEAKIMYETAKNVFVNASKTLTEKLDQLKEKGKRERIKRLGGVALVRVDYCTAKMKLEEAKLLEMHGKHQAAAKNFAISASQFEKIYKKFEIEQDSNDLKATYYLCKAWESMALAKEYKEPKRYEKAASLFINAKELFTDLKLKLLAQGNSAICRALDLGYKFDEAIDYKSKASINKEIKQILSEAASSHGKGGFKSGEYWAIGTSLYFDAMWNLNEAQEKLDLIERKLFLDRGTKNLKSALKMFHKAGYKDKEEEIKVRLSSIESDDNVLLSASSVLIVPSITSSTSGIKAPACPVETSQSIEMGDVKTITQKLKKTITNLPIKKSKTGKKVKNVLVFVSYATKDAEDFKIKDIAENLTKFKKINNVLYWQENTGDNIIKFMNDNLGKSDLVLLFCSANALTSEPVEKEWTAAEIMSKPIIPIFNVPDHIPPLLRPRLGIQYNPSDFQDNIKRIYDLILKKLSLK